MHYRSNPEPETRTLYCQRCAKNTSQTKPDRNRYNDVDFSCDVCQTPAYLEKCYDCGSMQPRRKHWSGVFQCGVYGHPYERDTMCQKCFLWTHDLTPGGKGKIYHSWCKPDARYRRNSTMSFAYGPVRDIKCPNINCQMPLPFDLADVWGFSTCPNCRTRLVLNDVGNPQNWLPITSRRYY